MQSRISERICQWAMNRVYDNAASECDHCEEEDVKDFLDRAEGDREFFRFIWAMRMSRLLAERGLRDITIKYEIASRQWHFSLRWGFFRVKRPFKLESAFKAAVSRMGRKLPDGTFTVTHEGDVLTGRFTAQRRNILRPRTQKARSAGNSLSA